jgi:small-conductance mechanosensitive channel
MVPVALESDIDQALAVINQVAVDMKHDAQWQSLIIDQPNLLGVDILDHVGATARLWIKTLPLKQWDVAREYRRRLKLAFDQVGIKLGVPKQSIWVQADSSPIPVTGQHNGQAVVDRGTSPTSGVLRA